MNKKPVNWVNWQTRYELAQRDVERLTDRLHATEARLAESDRLLRAAIADRESAWNAFYEQQARLAEAVTVLRTIRSMATLPQGLDARAFSVIMGTADSAPAVEMQPGSPSFDGAAAYGRYLDATVSADAAHVCEYTEASGSDCIHCHEPFDDGRCPITGEPDGEPHPDAPPRAYWPKNSADARQKRDLDLLHYGQGFLRVVDGVETHIQVADVYRDPCFCECHGSPDGPCRKVDDCELCSPVTVAESLEGK